MAALGLPVAFAALSSFGCTVNEKFDPTGGDVAVSVTWTVEGMPATAETCAAAVGMDPEIGIGWVQLRLWEQYSGGDDYTQDDWLVDCAQGSLMTEAIVIPDTYRVGLYAVAETAEGETVDASNVLAAAIVTVSAEPGGTLVASLDLSPSMSE